MRKLALLLLAAAVPALAAPAPQVFGARSPHHELRLERTFIAPGQIAYTVTVVDLDSGKTLLTSQLKSGQPLEATGDAEGQHVAVHIIDGGSFSALVHVHDDAHNADEFRTSWMLPMDQRGPNPATQTLNAPPGALRVGGDVKAPILVNRVEPVYTEVAKRAGVSGIIIAETLIDKTGRVKDVVILKPLPFGLDQAAVDAVKQWQFKPGTLNGEPVDVIYNVVVNFKLPPPPAP